MLFFCEDCGQKNIINIETVRADHNQYRCHSCNFLNKIENLPEETPQKAQPTKQKLPTPKKRSAKRKIHNLNEDPYTRVFKKLASSDDILGAYIYHFSHNILACDVSHDLADERMLTIGKALSTCCLNGQKSLQGTREVYLVLEDVVAISRSITTNSVLIFLCPSFPVKQEIIRSLHVSVNNLQVFI